MHNNNKESIKIIVSKNSLKSLKKIIRNIKKEDTILFRLNSDLDRNENIRFMDIFRDLHYKKFKLMMITENSKFLRNLFEGYVPEIIEGNLVVKNY